MSMSFRRHAADEGEEYFVSMTDLMVGVLFVFIIMLMYFVLRHKDARQTAMEATAVTQAKTQRLQDDIARFNDIKRIRTKILREIKSHLDRESIAVRIDIEHGIVRLPEHVLFHSGQANLNESAQVAVEHLAHALMSVLPCYTRGLQSTLKKCDETPAYVEAVFIEGHTDKVTLSPSPQLKDNLDLSAIRATNTFRALLAANPILLSLKSPTRAPVLSVSGYGEHRPAEPYQLGEEEKAGNRRIDLRILMATPQTPRVRAFREDFASEH